MEGIEMSAEEETNHGGTETQRKKRFFCILCVLSASVVSFFDVAE
jgi:hypothetical protein